MRFIAVYIATLLITQVVGLSFNNAIAAPAESHKHNGREHKHILPATGIKHYHKHMHNGRAHIHPYSAEVGFKHSHNLTPRAKAWANAVKHQHAGKSHSHPLPRSGIKHQHSHKHGGRSHIHPFTETGEKHFHNVNKTKTSSSSKPVETLSNEANSFKKLSIKQQMKALLDHSLLAMPKAKPSQNKTTSTIKPKEIIDLRDKKYLALLKTKSKKAVRPTRAKKTKKALRKNRKASLTPVRKLNKTSTNTKRIAERQTPQQIAEGNRQFSIALRYENGTGVKKNLRQAVNWYLRAAKNGNVKAQFNLASLYEKGKGVARNTPQAIRWYYLAANNGDANAQVSLGDKYARGKNVSKNINKAVYWYQLAADQGDVRGREGLDHLIEKNKGLIKR